MYPGSNLTLPELTVSGMRQSLHLLSHREAVMALRSAHYSVFTSKGEFAQPGYATKDFSLMDTRSREESNVCPPPLHIHAILQMFSPCGEHINMSSHDVCSS